MLAIVNFTWFSFLLGKKQTWIALEASLCSFIRAQQKDGHFQSCSHLDDLKLKMYIFEVSIVCLCLYLIICYIVFLKYSILTATL